MTITITAHDGKKLVLTEGIEQRIKDGDLDAALMEVHNEEAIRSIRLYFSQPRIFHTLRKLKQINAL